MISLKRRKVKQHLKNTTRASVIGALLITLSACSATQRTITRGQESQDWKMVKTDKSAHPSWTIYTRKIAGTDLLEYKIKGAITSSPKACVVAFRQDILNQAADRDNKKYPIYKITDRSKERLLTYVIHNEPFPLKDTEMSVRYEFYNAENGIADVKWHEAWDECVVQPSKKLNRVETFRGSWNFSQTSSNSRNATNSIQFDLRGMPLWLAEPMVTKFLKKGLEKIREITSA